MKNTQKYYFRIRAGNARIVLASEAYATEAGCVNGLLSVMKNAPHLINYIIKKAITGQPYFVLRARNKKIIGVSETYSCRAACKKGILSVMRNANRVETFRRSE